MDAAGYIEFLICWRGVIGAIGVDDAHVLGDYSYGHAYQELRITSFTTHGMIPLGGIGEEY